MLERIEIRNFQSYKSTIFDLSCGVNTIQGNSDCGKSAVLRALNWLVFNPAGDYFVSNWAKKGKRISEPCEVTVLVDGHKVTRKRDSDFNGYILDGQVFEATRNSVPEQIQAVLGISEVNIQKQLDPPFLLSMSPGDVSRYVNNLVNLSKIDVWTTAINGKTRKLGQEVEANEARVSKSRNLVESYSWVHDAEKLSSKISQLDTRKTELETMVGQMKNTLFEHSCKLEELTSFPDVDKALALLNDCALLVEKILKLETSKSELSEQISNYDNKSKSLSELPNLVKVYEILDEAMILDDEVEKIKNNLVGISCDINKRLEIIVPELPENLFSLLGKLERYKNVQAKLNQNAHELKNEILEHGSKIDVYRTCVSELEPVLETLSKMVCPLCGRSGEHEHETKE